MKLEERYNKEIKDAMMAKFNYKSVMEIPKLVTVVINMGVSDARENSKACEAQLPTLQSSQVRSLLSQRQESPLLPLRLERA